MLDCGRLLSDTFSRLQLTVASVGEGQHGHSMPEHGACALGSRLPTINLNMKHLSVATLLLFVLKYMIRFIVAVNLQVYVASVINLDWNGEPVER